MTCSVSLNILVISTCPKTHSLLHRAVGFQFKSHQIFRDLISITYTLDLYDPVAIDLIKKYEQDPGRIMIRSG